MEGMVNVFINAINDSDNEFTVDDVPERWREAVKEELEKRADK